MNREQIGRSTNSLHNSYELYFGKRPVYEIRAAEPGSPCYDVWKDGVKHQGFTSHYAAQCYVDHVRRNP